MPAGFVALRHDHVDAVVHMPLRVHGLACERRDLHTVLMGLVDHVFGRRPERVGDERDRMRERDLDVAMRNVVETWAQSFGYVDASFQKNCQRF